MSQLILLRHLQSEWNLENRFTGWTDVPLSEEGKKSVKEVVEKIRNFPFDKVYTSPLKRNQESVSLILKELGKEDLPVVADRALDERNYGILTGMNKEEAKRKYGQEKIRLWRRSFETGPPEGESLKDVYQRVVPFFRENIEKDLREGKNVLVVASHNSLRAIVKYIEKISDDDIINLEIPYAGMLIYKFAEGIYQRSY
jgi:2,3-bisphosphoglycerate-dependent phosphoglycerate mutase